METDYPTFHRFRRLMRRWRLAEARAIKDPERRRAAIVQACGSLKCSRRDVRVPTVSFKLAPAATAAVMPVARSVWKCKSGLLALTLTALKWSCKRLGVMCVPSEQVTMKSVGFLPSHASLISFPSCGNTGWVVLLVAIFVALSPPFSHKKGLPDFSESPSSGAKGIRTPDPLHAMEMRYQLRHSPEVCSANLIQDTSQT